MKKKTAKTFFNENFRNGLKKISLVIFITVLIWVWADLSQDESYRDSSAIITIPSVTDPALWVRFEKGNAAEFRLKQVKVEGPVIRIAELKRDIAEGLFQLRFSLDARDLNLAESETPYNIALTPILRESAELRKRALKITECNPENVMVLVTRLVEKPVKIICYENTTKLENAEITPAQINMFVPPKWEGQALQASINLTSLMLSRARKEPIQARPVIELAPGITRQAETSVTIRLPENGINLIDKSVQGSLGFVVSPEILDKYRIEMDKYNMDLFTTTMKIKATESAFAAYNSQKYKLLLEIKAEDAQKDPAIATPVFNFPEEYVRRGEIMPGEKLDSAQFRLVPRN
jgi:hypothetical protein